MGAAEAVRTARRKARLTQAALAERAGISVPTISRIENGAHEPRFATVEQLLRACGMRLDLDTIAGHGIDRSTFRIDGPSDQVLRLAEGAGRYGVPGRDPTWDPRQHLQTLIAHGVRFVVIGGLCARAWGSPSVTDDTDICFEHSEENIRRLVAALDELGASLRNAPSNLAPIDERTFRHSFNLTFDTNSGKLDCLSMPAGISDFAELDAVAEEMELAPDLVVRIASLDDLMRMKRAAGRAKDRIELEVLAALRDERESRG